MKKRYLLFPCLLLVAALALAACGSSGNSEESKIEETIETAATSSDPANCTKLQTQEFTEQSTQTEGSEAVKKCEEEAKNEEGEKAESVAVSNVEVEGSEATAEAAITGGSFGDQTLELALVKEGEQWKLNEFVGFAKLDKPKLVEVLEKQFAKHPGEVPKEVASCVEEGFEEASQSEIEKYLLSGSSEPIEELAKECSSS